MCLTNNKNYIYLSSSKRFLKLGVLERCYGLGIKDLFGILFKYMRWNIFERQILAFFLSLYVQILIQFYAK